MGGRRAWMFWMLVIFGTLSSESLNAIQAWFLGYWARQYEVYPADKVDVA